MSVENTGSLHYEYSASSLIVSTDKQEEAFRVVATESAYQVAWISIREKAPFCIIAFALPELKACEPRITEDTSDSLKIKCGQLVVSWGMNAYNPAHHSEISVTGRGNANFTLIKELFTHTAAPSIIDEQNEFLIQGIYRHLISPHVEPAAIIG